MHSLEIRAFDTSIGLTQAYAGPGWPPSSVNDGGPGGGPFTKTLTRTPESPICETWNCKLLPVSNVKVEASHLVDVRSVLPYLAAARLAHQRDEADTHSGLRGRCSSQ